MRTMGEYFGSMRRNTTNLSQTELAKRLRVTPQFVSNWERGKSNPPLKYYKKLALLLGIHKYDIESHARSLAEQEVEKAFR